ncbi:MAG: hypothetical protein MRZ79_00920 [Bacteroidia bacterium]|nr:hypothetical protein [Bacteroidia bacterium]
MNPKLRKRHRWIWMAWALILPILFALAVLLIPQQEVQNDEFPVLPDQSSHTQTTQNP